MKVVHNVSLADLAVNDTTPLYSTTLSYQYRLPIASTRHCRIRSMGNLCRYQAIHLGVVLTFRLVFAQKRVCSKARWWVFLMQLTILVQTCFKVNRKDHHCTIRYCSTEITYFSDTLHTKYYKHHRTIDRICLNMFYGVKIVTKCCLHGLKSVHLTLVYTVKSSGPFRLSCYQLAWLYFIDW